MQTSKQQALAPKKNQKQKNKRTRKAQPLAANSTEGEPQTAEEGLYALIQQDEALREYHLNCLLATPGYEQLSREQSADIVDAMLRFCTLSYELAQEDCSSRES